MKKPTAKSKLKPTNNTKEERNIGQVTESQKNAMSMSAQLPFFHRKYRNLVELRAHRANVLHL